MKKKFNFSVLRMILLSCAFVFSVLGVIAPVSCRLTEEGIEIVPSDTEAPRVEQFSVISPENLKISCSEKIVLADIFVFEIDGDEEADLYDFSVSEENAFAVADVITYSEDGKSAQIQISSSTSIGKTYIFSGRVFDISGNSLEFCQKFSGFNDRPARLIFNEIRNNYSADDQQSEFIEFYVLKDGNISGLEFVSVSKGEKKKYVFPAVDVRKGDYITLHGRTSFIKSSTKEEIPVENYADELDSELDLSKTPDSCETGRDLWYKGSDKMFANTDVLLLRDSDSKEIRDILFLSSSGAGEWQKKFKEYAEKANALGLWQNCESQKDAVCMKSSSVKRSVFRNNTKEIAKKYSDSSLLPDYILSSADDWSLSEDKKVGSKKVITATPGYKN